MGFRLSLISTFYSGVPAAILVGSADINSDGINGDLLPGTRRGGLGREVSDVAALNDAIRAYNLLFAGTRNPRNQLLPFVVEMPDGTRFGDSFISQDIQLSYVLRLGENQGRGDGADVQRIQRLEPGRPSGAAVDAVQRNAATLATLPAGFSLASDGSVRDASGNQGWRARRGCRTAT